jgi:adenylate kinase
VLHLVVPVEVLVGRLHARRVCSACGTNADPTKPDVGVCANCGGALVTRADDDEQVVRNRLQIYEDQTAPLVNYYQERPTFFTIDGNLSPDAVADAMKDALASAMGVAQGGAR